MQMTCVSKTQFTGLNDKRFYFHDGIVWLPFGHFLLNKVREKKEKYEAEIQHEIQSKKYDFLKEEAAAVRQCERLRILRSIFSQPALFCLLNSNILMKTPPINSTRDYILNSNWQKNMQSIYDAQFRGNILFVGNTGCGKTHFAQKLGLK